MYKIFSEMIERIKKMTFKDWLILILSVLLLLVFLEARMYRIRSEQQTVILQDSLTTYKNKAKEEYAAKNIYIQSAKELKKQNNELADEMKKLKDNPVVITKTKVVTKIVEVPMNSASIGNSTAHHDTEQPHHIRVCTGAVRNPTTTIRFRVALMSALTSESSRRHSRAWKFPSTSLSTLSRRTSNCSSSDGQTTRM